ncbi:MAG TPA: hypothetical protein VFI34_11415 [Candidatus Limnocylindrales bacterium]|nr:hypothetical protein [Candidatus Limnocylindrales bacterium]
MDVDAISSAIAARYAPAQVTPPATLTNVRVATSDLPDELGPLPAVLVVPDSGSLAPGNGTRVGEHVWLVRFYLDRVGDLPRQMNVLRRWVGVLVDQHRTGMQLGGLVVYVRTIGWAIRILPFQGSDYAGIELRLAVGTVEAWAPSS